MNSLEEKPIAMGLYDVDIVKITPIYLLAADGLYYHRTRVIKGEGGNLSGKPGSFGHKEGDFDTGYNRIYEI